MTIDRLKLHSQVRLIVNPIVEAYNRRWWVPREDLQQMDVWLRSHGFWAVRYRNAAGHTIELTRGGLVGATGADTRKLLEALATENQRAGVNVHSITNQRRAEMSRS